jgi:hypothetical protein
MVFSLCSSHFKIENIYKYTGTGTYGKKKIEFAGNCPQGSSVVVLPVYIMCWALREAKQCKMYSGRGLNP